MTSIARLGLLKNQFSSYSTGATDYSIKHLTVIGAGLMVRRAL